MGIIFECWRTLTKEKECSCSDGGNWQRKIILFCSRNLKINWIYMYIRTCDLQAGTLRHPEGRAVLVGQTESHKTTAFCDTAFYYQFCMFHNSKVQMWHSSRIPLQHAVWQHGTIFLIIHRYAARSPQGLGFGSGSQTMLGKGGVKQYEAGACCLLFLVLAFSNRIYIYIYIYIRIYIRT